ncbi:efflux RND transporter periplasmic adaptor subunit [Candidatus Desantisbacteria bacterium]|nr:efflux RND transporter periplasmic adaptor subunit [Candidatus Desantisbacteria bacterium]
MNKKIIIIVILAVISGIVLGYFLGQQYQIKIQLQKKEPQEKPIADEHKNHTQTKKDELYYCPMHPGFVSDKPGECAICGMKLVKKEEAEKIEKEADTAEEICILHTCEMANCEMKLTGDIKNCPFCGKHITKEEKVSYYADPENPDHTSHTPQKNEKGKKYTPVYKEKKNKDTSKDVHISSDKQELIGIKKDKIQERVLIKLIDTVGKVAYDPDLFVAQQEYLQVLKAQENTQGSSIEFINEQTKSLVNAAKQKLLLSGMNEKQIAELAELGKAQKNLYLPALGETVWIYMTIYEYEIGMIKEGQLVEIESVAYPGKIFEGKLVSASPVLDPNTRSLKIRAEVKNPGNLLKPDMYVNAKIKINLGKKLAVAEEAVMDTGERKVIFIAKPKGYFESREVKLGTKAGNYYEVINGVSSGEIVVTSGNFFIDSETRLKSAVSGEMHKH